MTEEPTQAGRTPRTPARGLRVGSPFGVPVYLAPSWFLIAGVLTLLFATTVDSRVPNLATPVRYLVSLAFVLMLYGSVLVHELSHSVVALRLGLPVRRITIFLIGGVSELDREPEDPGDEYLIAMAGPLLSLILATVGTAVAVLMSPHTVPRLLVEEVALANGLVTVFNLLPGLPLDGGRVLRSIVWKLTGSPESGAVVAAWAGRGLAVLVAAVPFAVASVSSSGASTFSLLWFSLLAAFLWSGATQSLRVARLKGRLPSISLARLTRPAIPTTTATPLAVALAQLEQARAGSLIVVDGHDQPVAVVSEAMVAAIPVERRPWIPVAEVSVSLKPGSVLPAELSGEALLMAMRAAPAGEYLVVDSFGATVGVLATTDVARIVTA